MLMIEDGNGEASGRDCSDAVESTIGGGAAAMRCSSSAGMMDAGTCEATTPPL
jgi:hypothetical protein